MTFRQNKQNAVYVTLRRKLEDKTNREILNHGLYNNDRLKQMAEQEQLRKDNYKYKALFARLGI